MSEELAIDQLRSWIGKQEQQSDTITDELLKRFRATLGAYTKLDENIPLGLHWCLAQPAADPDTLGLDGHPAKGGFLPPVPLPRRMWASGRLQFHKSPNIDAPIQRISTVTDVTLKQSAASGPLVFVQVDHQHVQSGATLIEESQTLVYRKPAAFKPAPIPDQIPSSAHSLNIMPDSTLLFRYSALTFNGHRIHYDQPYTTAEEGYPGLVVHGPLMATLLMNLAQSSRPNTRLRVFQFRGLAPAFVDQGLELAIVDDEDNSQSLEIRNQAGALIMSATAGFGHATA